MRCRLGLRRGPLAQGAGRLEVPRLCDAARITERLYHLALRAEWEDALMSGSYRRSTLGRSLEDEGFIHCSFPNQVQKIADLIYRGRDDVVLLEIDASVVTADVRVEPVGPDEFPHIYGELPVDAVVQLREVPIDGEGRLLIGSLLD